MKTITLHIPDDVYKRLRNGMTARIMCGAACGILDAFVGRVLERVGAGATEHTFELVTEPEEKKS